jgi:transcriptional regulator with GAF, ATPase, and Fis domain
MDMPVIAESLSMRAILVSIEKLATSTIPVMILGESGTGKELVATAIHRASDRAEKPFVKINCAALHEELLESELFGHVRGAFTGANDARVGRFEQAHMGTLLFDEIGDMSLRTQAKLLRALQGGSFERLGSGRSITVDVRILSATNKNLEHMVQAHTFREDLYYRLMGFVIRIPPLRERREDILPMARSFLKEFLHDRGEGAVLATFTPRAETALMDYDWPGNIREMQTVVRRALIEAGEVGRISIEHLSFDLAGNMSPEPDPDHTRAAVGDTYLTLVEIEKRAIMLALERAQGVQKNAAKELGISPRVMNYKVRTFGLTHPRWTRNRERETSH